ncbi:MAG: methyltransferase domain-containing protein [Planctomycetota bacterium]
MPLGDASFDLVVSSLAIDYVYDWSTPLAEFHRLLKATGRLVFSVQHPMGSYKWLQPPTAFGVHYCEVAWKGFTKTPVVVPDYYRSFEEIVNPLLAAGFQLEGILETRPLDALRAIHPKKYRQNATFPTFMVISARRVDR